MIIVNLFSGKDFICSNVMDFFVKARHCSHCFQLRASCLLALFLSFQPSWGIKMGSQGSHLQSVSAYSMSSASGRGSPCGIGVEVIVRQEGDAAEVDRQIRLPISLLVGTDRDGGQA